MEAALSGLPCKLVAKNGHKRAAFQGQASFWVADSAKTHNPPLKGAFNRTVRAFKTALWGL
jgi:hypothetical protein